MTERIAAPSRVRKRLRKLKSRLLGYEYLVCALFMPNRLRLPKLAPNALIPEFDQIDIHLSELPKGGWSMPVADLVLLLKLVAARKPQRVLELGSFRGFTALAIARNLQPSGRVVAVDMNPDHGQAYRETPWARMIDRRTGKISSELFADDPPASYDLIFIDADHRRAAVDHDTKTVLPLLRPDGIMIWHDYANWGYFSGTCGVPEHLHVLGKTLPIAHLTGSTLAVYSPAWGQELAGHFERAIQTTREWLQQDVWDTPVSKT